MCVVHGTELVLNCINNMLWSIQTKIPFIGKIGLAARMFEFCFEEFKVDLRNYFKGLRNKCFQKE